MTGFGHFTYFYKKEDYSLARVVKVLLRLNLFTFGLSYALDSDYQAYYFSPLVSFWFIMIYLVMLVGAQFNKNDWVIVVKLLFLFCTSQLLSLYPGAMNELISLLALCTKSRWDATEWSFRFSLDRFAVVYGMVIAYVHCRRPALITTLMNDNRFLISIISIISLIIYFAFEVQFEDKVSLKWAPRIAHQ